MTEKHYQWQNEHLLPTIYPLRLEKLRDFLIRYQEIEIWKIYKKKSDEDLKDQKNAYRAHLAKSNIDLLKVYQGYLAHYQRDYFDSFKNEVIAAADQEILHFLKNQHTDFLKRFIEFNRIQTKIYSLKGYRDVVEKLVIRIEDRIEENKRFMRNNPSRKEKFGQIVQTLETTLPIAKTELNKLNEFRIFFNEFKPHKAKLDKWIEKKSRDRKKIIKEINQKNKLARRSENVQNKEQLAQEIERLEKNLRRVNVKIKYGFVSYFEDLLRAEREKKIITKEDIARWESEKFKKKLEKLDHKELLSKIVKEFINNPKKYPLWLQYMVIHFSGMRYKPAYGSWADPRILLQELIRENVQLDFGVDWDLQAVEKLTLEEALGKIEALKNEVPKWMWKEIVAHSPLRTIYAEENWENLTAEELDEKSKPEFSSHREAMRIWKDNAKNTWRKEHERTNQLIVSKAVCNEVAEHIQHLRGHPEKGGLTAKPDWYLGEENRPNQEEANRAYFQKTSSADQFKIGASILWLRWVDYEPPLWQIAPQRTLRNGQKILPDTLFRKKVPKNIEKTLIKEIGSKAGKKGKKSRWLYQVKNNIYKRTQVRVEEIPKPNNGNSNKKDKAGEIKNNKKKVNNANLAYMVSEEWLRWIHEATVVKVAETADGPSVLTFETARPGDGSQPSTIGIMRHSERALHYSVSETKLRGIFVGYAPIAMPKLPNIKKMLDWRKIVPWEEIDQSSIAQYWKEIEMSLEQAHSPIQPDIPEIVVAPEAIRKVEAIPDYKSRNKEFLVTWQVTVDKKRPGKFKAIVVDRTIKIRRGLHFEVSKTDVKTVNGKSYARNIECLQVPKAVDYYVQEADIIELPDNRVSIPMEVIVDKVNLQELDLPKGANDKGYPKFVPSGVFLFKDMKLRVSTVHNDKIGKSNQSGIIKGDSEKLCYLVLSCPLKPDAQGYYIFTDAVSEVSEDEYELEKTLGSASIIPDQPVLAWVAPETKKHHKTEMLSAKLHQQIFEGGKNSPPKFKLIGQILPKDEMILVGRKVFSKNGMPLFPIKECAGKPSVSGLFIREKDVVFEPPKISKFDLVNLLKKFIPF